MNKKVFFGHNDLRFFYYRYKDSHYYSLSILLTTIIVCAFLVFNVVIPQSQAYFSIRSETEALRTEIKTINDNIAFMSNIDKSELDSQLSIATRALPTDKDFAGIINAISESAIRSGVSVQDFSFSLDGTSSKPEDVNINAKNTRSKIDISFGIEGSRDGGKKFLTEISEKIPLAEITAVRGDSRSLNISVFFYYQPLSNISLKESERITAPDESKKELLRKLSSWQTDSANEQIIPPVGTSSAVPLF